MSSSWFVRVESCFNLIRYIPFLILCALHIDYALLYILIFDILICLVVAVLYIILVSVISDFVMIWLHRIDDIYFIVLCFVQRFFIKLICILNILCKFNTINAKIFYWFYFHIYFLNYFVYFFFFFHLNKNYSNQCKVEKFRENANISDREENRK